MLQALSNIELPILDFIQENLRTPFFDHFFSGITHLGDAGWFWILLAVVFLFIKKYRRTGIAMGIALICGLIVGNATLKPLIARIRPYDINTAVELLISKPHDFSFPSGHTLASFEAATVMLIHDKKIGVPALIVACLIAFSRMYLYVHYPTDILAGLILGVIFGIVGCAVVKYAEPKLLERIEAGKKNK